MAIELAGICGQSVIPAVSVSGLIEFALLLNG